MATTARTQRRYDHRFRDLVRTTRNIDCALQRGVPRSTARSWLGEPNAEVVTVDVLDMNALRLQQEVLRLRARVQKLRKLCPPSYPTHTGAGTPLRTVTGLGYIRNTLTHQ